VCMQACIGENGQPLGIAIVATAATCAGDLGGLPVGSAQTLACELVSWLDLGKLEMYGQ
jgi:hypothetical protein